MALFSQRFWLKLSALDARVIASLRAQQGTFSRLLIGRRLVIGSSLVDYWSELQAATRDAQLAVADLNHFCSGRSKMRVGGLSIDITEDAALALTSQPLLVQ